MTPADGKVYGNFRVVTFTDFENDEYAALVEEVDSGRPLAHCYRADVAEKIAYALSCGWSPGMHFGNPAAAGALPADTWPGKDLVPDPPAATPEAEGQAFAFGACAAGALVVAAICAMAHAFGWW